MRIVRIMLVGGIVALLGASAVWASGAATLKVEKTKIGKVVADSRGHTLYMFRADHGGKSACYGSCARYWPPLTTAGKPKAGAGIEAALLGTIKRKDGKLEVRSSSARSTCTQATRSVVRPPVKVRITSAPSGMR